jgi:5-formyltetrahydrofolate cyclo-ligase
VTRAPIRVSARATVRAPARASVRAPSRESARAPAHASAEARATRAKQKIREQIWKRLRTRGAARFPFPLEDRIPNFRGAEAAAARLAQLPEWQRARRLKCNPDAPQRAVRLRALEDGKEVFMAVPRLRDARCFLRLDPRRLRGRLSRAATIGGASALGEAVPPDALGHIDLVVAGSVAVNGTGARVGKGGGYSDLEWAMARALGIVDDETPVVTTVHDLQVVEGAIPMTDHDVPVDVVVTPTRVIRARRRRAKPRGIRWDELSDAQVAAMPVLASLHGRPKAGAPSARRLAPTSAPPPRRSR